MFRGKKLPSFVQLLMVFGVITMVIGSIGCGARPYASIGHPQVYTFPHIKDAMEQLGKDSELVSVRTRLIKHFMVSNDAYNKSKVRLDELLDQNQRSAAFVQQVRTLVDLNVTINLLKKEVDVTATPGTGTTTPAPGTGTGTPTPGTGTTTPAPGTGTATPSQSTPATGAPTTGDKYANINTILTRLDKIYTALETEGVVGAADSPFDQLDRASDMYTAFLIKFLRSYLDSNAQFPPANQMDPIPGNLRRQLFLVLQTHVHAGSKPNHMTGVRIKIISASNRDGTKGDPDDVKIQRLHPTRPYDIEQIGFEEAFDSARKVAAEVTAPLEALDIKAKLNAEADSREAARRRFLNRIGKQASFADAGRHEFGWDFYPNNIEVVERSAIDRAVNALFGEPERWHVQAFLEGGARDCSVHILVPAKLKSFTCQIRSFHADIDRQNHLRGEATVDPAEGTFTVELPAYDIREANTSIAGGGGSWKDTELGHTEDDVKRVSMLTMEVHLRLGELVAATEHLEAIDRTSASSDSVNSANNRLNSARKLLTSTRDALRTELAQMSVNAAAGIREIQRHVAALETPTTRDQLSKIEDAFVILVDAASAELKATEALRVADEALQ